MLGVAQAHPDLLVIEGTTNVIEEIGRTSLRIASLIHEYTRLPSISKLMSSLIDPVVFIMVGLIGRTLTSQLSDDMKSQVAQCQKCCDDLKQKFNTRLNIEIEAVVKEIKGDSMYRFPNDVYFLRINGDGYSCQYTKSFKDKPG